MSDRKAFQIALLISFLVHSVFFFASPRPLFIPRKKSLKNIKVVYYKFKKPRKRPGGKAKIRKRPAVNKLPEIKKEEILPSHRVAGNKKTIEKEKTTVVKRQERKDFAAVVKEEKNDAKKATYISYYRAVREKIRQFADRNYPRNLRAGVGEVFLSFVVASSGELLEVRVIDGRSVNNYTLRDIAINSIRDASPFPPFPEQMEQSQITFNVIISFELNR